MWKLYIKDILRDEKMYLVTQSDLFLDTLWLPERSVKTSRLQTSLWSSNIFLSAIFEVNPIRLVSHILTYVVYKTTSGEKSWCKVDGAHNASRSAVEVLRLHCLGILTFKIITETTKYKVVQIWPGQTVTCIHTISPGHIWTTLYILM